MSSTERKRRQFGRSAMIAIAGWVTATLAALLAKFLVELTWSLYLAHKVGYVPLPL